MRRPVRARRRRVRRDAACVHAALAHRSVHAHGLLAGRLPALGTALRVALALLALVVPAMLMSIPPPAHAATETVVRGEVLRLVTIQDEQAMAAMSPGETVAWDVGVSAERDDGTIRVALEADVTADAFRASVAVCDERWTAEGCPGGGRSVADVALVDGAIDLGTQPASADRWYRIAVVLDVARPGARADLVVRATGLGDHVASDGAAELPPTGARPALAVVAVALVALAAGALLSRAARRRRESVA